MRGDRMADAYLPPYMNADGQITYYCLFNFSMWHCYRNAAREYLKLESICWRNNKFQHMQMTPRLIWVQNQKFPDEVKEECELKAQRSVKIHHGIVSTIYGNSETVKQCQWLIFGGL